MAKTIAEGAKEINDLFQRAKAGDRDAKQEFITQHLESFLYVIRMKRSLATQSVGGLSDFVQQLRMKVHQCDFEDKDFESPRAFAAFLCKIADREVGQVERKQRRRGKTKSLEGLSQKENQQLVDAAPAPMAVQAAEEAWQIALRSLKSPLQRDIAQLLRHDVAHGEIATLLGTSERSVCRTANTLDEALLAGRAGAGVSSVACASV